MVYLQRLCLKVEKITTIYSLLYRRAAHLAKRLEQVRNGYQKLTAVRRTQPITIGLYPHFDDGHMVNNNKNSVNDVYVMESLFDMNLRQLYQITVLTCLHIVLFQLENTLRLNEFTNLESGNDPPLQGHTQGHPVHSTYNTAQ